MGRLSDLYTELSQQQAEAESQYIRTTTPGLRMPGPEPEPMAPEEEEQPGLLSDAWSSFGIGAGQLVKGAEWLFGTDTNVGQTTMDYWQDQLSDAQVEANEQRFVDEDMTLGEGFSNPRTWMGTIVQSLPMMVPGIGAAGGAAKLGIRAGMSKAGATAAGAAAGSSVEGATIGALVGEEVEQVILNAPIEELQNSPYFQDLIEAGKGEDEARQMVAKKASEGAGLQAGVVGAVLGIAFNKFVGDAVTGRLSERLLKETGKGVAEGTTTEAAQTGVESYAKQTALNENLGRPYNLSEAANEIVGGTGAGGVMGGAVGFGGGLAGSNTPEQPAATGEEPPTPQPATDPQAEQAVQPEQPTGPDEPAFDDGLDSIGQRITEAENQPISIRNRGRNLASAPEAPTPLSEQVGTDVSAEGPQIVYQQDGITVEQEDNQFRAYNEDDLEAFGTDAGDARRKLNRQIERNWPKGPILQNRDRNTPAYIAQMREIAQNPKYNRVSTSREPTTGAPMAFPRGIAPEIPAMNLGRKDTVTMSDGKGGEREVPVQYAVVEADDVQASHRADGKENKGYTADGLIALNNGRTAGLQAAYEQGNADPYLQAMLSDDMHGIDPAAIRTKRRPMLIRLFDGQSLEGIDNPGDASNTSPMADLSLSEQAKTDAGKLDNAILSEIQPGDPTGSSNADFVSRAVDAIGKGDTDTVMRDREGLLTSAGQRRIRGALIARAYSDDTLTQELVEATDSDLKTLGDALTEVAGRWALMREQAQGNAINPDMDVTDALVSAVNMIRKSRQEGRSLKDIAGQIDAFAGEADQMAVYMLSLFYRGASFNRIRSKDAIAGALSNYIETALQSSPGVDMFGEQTQPQEVLSREAEQAEGSTGEQAQEAAPRVRTDGPDNRDSGAEGEGSGRETGREEDAGSGEQVSAAGETENLTPDLAVEVEQAGTETDTNPSDGQKEAGNYKKGKVRIQGLDIAIENPKGSTRSGTDPDGNRWESTMAHHYGDIKGTKAADGDNLDVFIGPYPEIDQVFVIDQPNADGSFDEHKVMLGFANEADARQGYLDNYEDGWKVGPITRMTMDEFKAWMQDGDTTKPVAQADAVEPELELTEDPRFSRTGPRNLFVAHNLSEQNLEYVMELGGLAAPSLAVGRTDQGFSDFGEITLLAPASMLESSRARTFDADAYTPRQPRPEYEIDRTALQRQIEGLDNEYDLDVPAMDDLERDGMEAMARSPAYQYAWLKSRNKAPKAKRQKVDSVVRKIAKLGLDRFAMQTDPRVLKLAEAHYRDVQKQVREVLGEDAPRANLYFDEDGNLNHSFLSELTYKAARYSESGGYDIGQMKVDLNKKLRPKIAKRQYERWIKEQFNEVMEGKRMFNGFTYSGNRRYKPYTLENVVKEMTRQVQGGEGFNYGAGSVRSRYAQEMKRISQVQANRDRIVSPDEMARLKDESNERLQEVLSQLKPYYRFDADSWGYTDDASSAIGEGPKGWNEAFDLDAEGRAIITEFVDYLRNLPTAYFETKVGRAVDLAEFSVAIVPKGTSQETVDILRAKGLKVKRYDPADPDSRRQEIAKQEDLLFSKSGEYRRTPESRTATLTAQQGRTYANTLMRDWKDRPGVTVADSISEFPKPLREAIRQAGAESDMRAVFWNQEVYILAPRIPNTQALEEVILHEVVGHYGLRKMVGKELIPLLNRVYMDMARTEQAAEIKRNYYPGNTFDASNREHRLVVAEELLAHLAESGQQRHRTLWQRIVTAIRDGLRRLGFTVSMNENDLLKILEGAQRTVEQGGFSRPSEADQHLGFSQVSVSDAIGSEQVGNQLLANPDTLSGSSERQIAAGAILDLLNGEPLGVRVPLSEAGNGVAISPKDINQRAIRNAESFSNLVTSEAFIKQGYGGIDAETRGSMVSGMIQMIEDLKILDPVVELIPVDMMDVLAREQVSPEMLLGNESVFQETFPVNPDSPVSFMDAAGSLMQSVAILGAKKLSSSGLSDSVVLSSDRSSASSALEYRHDGSLADFGRFIVQQVKGISQGEGGFSRTGQTNTEAFRKWFGDSKVVDENGEPLVVYHGTAADITQFDPLLLGGSTSAPSARSAFFVTASPKVASGYALLSPSRSAMDVERMRQAAKSPVLNDETRQFLEDQAEAAAENLESSEWAGSVTQNLGEWAQKGANVLPVYVAMRNPMEVDYKGSSYRERKFSAVIKEAKEKGHDGVIFRNADDSMHKDYDEITDIFAVFEPGQIKSATGNSGAFNPSNPDIRFSRAGNRLDAAATHFNDLTDDQRAALGKIAPRTPKERAQDWLKERTDRWQTKVRQGAVDRFAALADVDMAVHGRDVIENSTASSSWVLAQMSGSAAGALQSMLTTARVKLNQREKVITTQDGTQGLNDTLKQLGSAAEIERFFGWIAGNRSKRLMAEGRENLFEPQEVEALAQLNRGTTDSGQSRFTLYESVFREFQQYRDDVLAIAEQSGIITPEQRETWANEFYVPFYRLAEDDGSFTGPKATGGISRQEAYKKLKGGSRPLNDLLENTMMNFYHLLQASLKNQAAMQAMDNSQEMGIAREVREADRDTENSTFILRDGQKIWYEIDDPLVFKAVTALAHPGMNSTAMKMMRGFKRLFTNLTTTTPQFVIANLLRDSMQAAATSEVSKNILRNMAQGSKVYGDPKIRAKMLASGGSFSFGHLYGENADELRLRITGGLAQADILRSPSMIPNAISGMWRKWNEMTEFTENINRAAIFEQNQDRGELYAAFKARDLMNFSQHGAWPAMRVLIDVVPFLNARLQGLDKIYRSGVKPGLRTAMGQGTASEKQAAMRFWSVTGTLALASIALYLNNRDDEEYKKLEEWQRDSYWYFRVSDDHAIFIPKPFEVGAIATMAERLTEQAVSDTATGKLFASRLSHMLLDTFSFSPVPQMFQPALDIYSNYDAFTGRPIESMGMERLSPSLRRRNNTTALATGLSAATESVFGSDGRMTLSPVQIDHAIQGYFGSVGSWVAGIADTVWRTANGETAPSTFWYENQPVRRFYKNLGDEDRYTRYGTVFYEALKETNRVYADIKEYAELGEVEKARSLYQENRNKLAYRVILNRVQRKLSEINSAMQKVRRLEASPEHKRRELDRLRAMKNRIQEAVGGNLERLNASDS